MLQAAAAAVLKMPSLATMEIWNGRRDVAMVFRYQRAHKGQPPIVTCRGSWDLTLRQPVIKAWDILTMTLHGRKPVYVVELLHPEVDLKSHGDAIQQLKLSGPSHPTCFTATDPEGAQNARDFG